MSNKRSVGKWPVRRYSTNAFALSSTSVSAVVWSRTPQGAGSHRPIKKTNQGLFFLRSFCHRPLLTGWQPRQLLWLVLLFHLLPPSQPPQLASRMGRRRTQRACATIPRMLSSTRCASEHHRVAAEAEVSAAAAGATGSEAACPGDCGGTNSGGRSPAATTSSTGVAEGAEHLGDSPAGKPGPEPDRMDHHQPGTGRYQVVSSRPPPRPPGIPGLSPFVSPSLLPRIIPGGDVLAFFGEGERAGEGRGSSGRTCFLHASCGGCLWLLWDPSISTPVSS